MLDLERRNTAKPVEYRVAQDGPGTLDGYAAVYGKYSQNLGGFVEVVDADAFRKSLGDAVAVVARYNHDDNHLLGTTEAGTLRLTSDEIGLRYEVDLPNTTSGNDTSVLAKRGDIRYSSFAFHVIEDEWGITEQGFPLRTLKQVHLVDVAPVNQPAYKDTSVGLRSLASHLGVEVGLVEAASTEELRSLIKGEPIAVPPEVRGEPEPVKVEQVENHSAVVLRNKLLDLDKLK